MDDTFAFIIHPIQIKRDVERNPLLGKLLTERQINFSRGSSPVYLSEIHGITSAATGKEVKGWLIAAPYTPPTMMSLPVGGAAYKKIVACGQMAEELGARIRAGRFHLVGGRRCRQRRLPTG
ncbi:MAG: hypothetical protein IPK52_11050 [Chloroflexi bacterium]|nr:hypothetical protein [Chloroflexota bacterium]